MIAVRYVGQVLHVILSSLNLDMHAMGSYSRILSMG